MSKLTPLLETIFMNHGGTPEHWRVSSKVLNEKAEESKHFIAFIKTKLKELDVEVQSMALDLTDYFMDEGKMPLFNQVSSKDFLLTLVNILKNRGASVIQEKILYLLKKWGIKFEKHKDIIPTFNDIYEQLKKSNAVFPHVTSPPYYRFLYTNEELEMKNNNSNFNNSAKENSLGKSSGSNFKDSAKGSKSNEKAGYPVFENKNVREFDDNLESKDEKTVDYSYKNYINISPDKFPSKYKKFVAELIVWMDNITLANETIENTDYKADIDEYLRSIIVAVRAAEKQLVNVIQSGFEEEDLMNICLTLNDDINKTLQRYECLKKKKKPEPFLTGFLLNDSMNPKFKVKKPEPKPVKQSIPKISGSSSNNQQNKIKADNLLDLQNNNAVTSTTNSNIPVKDVNDIFDLFSSSVKISDSNNPNNVNNNLNKSANFDNANKNLANKNELNPNNMIDLVTNLNQNQKAKQAEHMIDLSQLSNNNVNANNLGINDVKISNEPQQNKKIVDLEELLNAAYSNNNNNNFQGNPQPDYFMNNPQNNQAGYPMPMYGLPSNAPFNNQYQNPSLVNPNMMMPMPIVNPNNGQNYGFSPLGVDVNGNFINNHPNPMNNIPINNQGYPQGFNYPNQSVNYPAQPQNFQNMANVPNVSQQQQQQHPNLQQHQVDSNYPDFFN